MDAEKPNGSDRLEQNVERLLSRTPPERALPREARQRILSALTERAAAESKSYDRESRWGARRKRMGWNRPESWAAAAAVAIVVGLILLWPGGMQGGLAWADVARNLAEVKSVATWVVTEATPPSGPASVTHARLFQQDPGLSRTETYIGAVSPVGPGEAVPLEEIESVVLMSRSPGESVIVRLSPRERRGQRTTLSFSGKALEKRRQLPRHMVSEMFGRLRGLTEDQTRIVGEREIGGAPAVGFGARMAELMGDSPTPPPDGQVRVWVSRETALPAEIEVEFSGPDGTAHRTTYGPIEWNPPLSAELFTVPEPEGWEILDESIREVGFFRTSLQNGVTLNIGPLGGPALMTEEDVAEVVSARTVLEPGAADARTIVFMNLTADGARRVQDYTAAHLGETLSVNFNAETRYEIRIGGPIGAEMQIDVSALGLSPERFEEEYLSD